MFSVKYFVLIVKQIKLYGKNWARLHFVISNSYFFWFSHKMQLYSSVDFNAKDNDNMLDFNW